MRSLVVLLFGLLLAVGAWAQPSGKGVVANCTTAVIADGDCAGLGTGTRVYNTTTSREQTYDGSTWTVTGPGVFTAEHQRTKSFGADDGAHPDGTQCVSTPAAPLSLNSGPSSDVVVCGANDAATVYFSMLMPDNWDLGTFTVEISLTSDNADPDADGDIDADITALCRGDDELIDNTWAAEVAFDTDFDGKIRWDQIIDVSPAITPDAGAGATLNAGDHCYFRYQIDAAGTTATMSDVAYLSFVVQYTVNDLDEVD